MIARRFCCFVKEASPGERSRTRTHKTTPTTHNKQQAGMEKFARDDVERKWPDTFFGYSLFLLYVPELHAATLMEEMQFPPVF
jgi:hypothetical protein